MEGRQQELKDVFNLLESQESHVTEDIKKLIKDNLDNCKSFCFNHLCCTVAAFGYNKLSRVMS